MIKKLKKLLSMNIIVKNIMVLFKGNVLASIIGLINTTILVNVIGLENNGVIFMALSYVMLFNSIFNFQSYNAIIRFVPRAMEVGSNKVISYIKQGFFLDFSTAVLGIIAATIMIQPIAMLMKWDSVIINCIYIYILIILFKTTGTMLGILRIYNKFKETVYVNIVEVSIKLIFYILGWIKGSSLYYFALIEVLSCGVSMIVMIIFTYRAIKENSLSFRNIKWSLDKEFFKFNLYSNLEVAADLPITYITPFIINSILGFSDIAVYKIIEKIGSLILKITTPINQAIIPDLSKRIADNNLQGALSLYKKAIKLIGGIGFVGVSVVAVSSPVWISILLPKNINNIIALILYLIYIIFTNMFMALHPIFNFLGYIKVNIPLILISNLVYLIILINFANNYGVIGVIISRIIQAAIVVIGKELILRCNNYKERLI